MPDLFYRPENAWLADVIPFYYDGAFRLFYLLDWRDKKNHGEGTPWYQISTTDFVHYAEHGEMLARGSESEQDLYVFTGSVVEKQPQHDAAERFHIFYTGHNPHFHKQGKPVQAVMHAVSDDLLHWRKVPEDTFFAPLAGYEPDDWRDPFVFWNPDAGEYWMLLAARLKNNQDNADSTNSGAARRRGCTALCASKDLKTWEVRPPFWAPGLYFTHECPDLFRIGAWWYQVFSEFSDRCVTRYRMSRSLDGPWTAPENDTFDGRAFYAAKTVTDGTRRFVFGWNPTQEEEKDYRPFQWGGNLVVHELVQEADGALSVRPPQSVVNTFGPPVTPALTSPHVGSNCFFDDSQGMTISYSDSIGGAVAGTLPPACLIETTLSFAPGTRACGLMLRMSDDLDAGYYVRLEPGRNRLVFDSWPRAGDVPYMIGLERPLALAPNAPVHLRAFVEGTICEVYINDQIAMSCRMYNRAEGVWGVFVQEGRARFTNISIAERALVS